jgi:hypothetical protein
MRSHDETAPPCCIPLIPLDGVSESGLEGDPWLIAKSSQSGVINAVADVVSRAVGGGLNFSPAAPHKLKESLHKVAIR